MHSRVGLYARTTILKEGARINACPKSKRGFLDLRHFAKKHLDVAVDDRFLHGLFQGPVFVREDSHIDQVYRLQIRARAECLHKSGLFNGGPIPEEVLAELYDYAFSELNLAITFSAIERLIRQKAA